MHLPANDQHYYYNTSMQLSNQLCRTCHFPSVSLSIRQPAFRASLSVTPLSCLVTQVTVSVLSCWAPGAGGYAEAPCGSSLLRHSAGVLPEFSLQASFCHSWIGTFGMCGRLGLALAPFDFASSSFSSDCGAERNTWPPKLTLKSVLDW